MSSEKLESLLQLIPVEDLDLTGHDPARVRAFIDTWRGREGAERALYQQFMLDLLAALGLDAHDLGVRFDEPVSFTDGSGAKKKTGFADIVRPGVFVIEAKKGKDAGQTRGTHGTRGTEGYFTTMEAAFGQALHYARHLEGGQPPVLMVVDVGHAFFLWTAFGGAPFDGWGQRAEFLIEELADVRVWALLRDLLYKPQRRDALRIAARVTFDIATKLAALARSLEEAGHASDRVARFLMRALFTMFAEDVGLLPERAFERQLERWMLEPDNFVDELTQVWQKMHSGGSVVGIGRLPRFNGRLFADAEVLPLTSPQIRLLHEAAQKNWRHVEPSIFGTLLERALSPAERHRLGAHYTPRAYIERLVRAVVEAPLRREWEDVQAGVKSLVDVPSPKPAARKKAVALLHAYLKRLTSVRVLDPACGSGNFLYVTFDLLKRLELEVRARLRQLGESQELLALEGVSVSPAQLYGIEIKPWAHQIAELTVWIGYLQWWRRLNPNALPSEPILRDDQRHIHQGDAILLHDSPTPRIGPDNKPITAWDLVTMRRHPVTGELVPDESARVPVLDYPHARPAPWPQVDFVVGNPPFIGASRMRAALGDGYVEALRGAWRDVPDSADLVMYWWHHAAHLLQNKQIEGFGFITTNSISQIFNRRVIEAALGKGKIHISYAVPDHPWIDAADGAAVRIAMTAAHPGVHEGLLERVIREEQHGADDIAVTMEPQRGLIHADLKIGPNVAGAKKLAANACLSSPGVKLHGAGFIVTPEQAKTLGLGTIPGLERHIRHYRNGRDLTARPRGVMVIDLYGLTAEQVADRFPLVYKHVYDHVKPERDQNNREAYKRNWWIFGEAREDLRNILRGLPRYIATVETTKHRVFQFLDASILPDNMLIAIGSDDAYHLGVLSSRVHVVWALAAGGRLGVGNDPRYNKSKCFDTFPFPEVDEATAEAIRGVGERLDGHRKRVMGEHEGLGLTELYNVVEALRAGQALDAKQQRVNTQGLVSSHLLPLHEELDRLVARAYGWGEPVEALSDETILERLVALNAARAAEEAQGVVRWLRAAAPLASASQAAATAEDVAGEEEGGESGELGAPSQSVWPKAPQEQAACLRQLIKDEPGQTRAQLVARLGGEAVAPSVEAMLGILQALAVAVEVEGQRWF
jgi:hypothetical protein